MQVKRNEEILDWISIGVNIFTVVGVIVAIYVAWHTVKNDKKNLKLQGLGLVFEKFNNPDARKSRYRILNAYTKYLQSKNLPNDFTPSNFYEHERVDLTEINPELKSDIIKVKSDFEEVAVMEKNGMIDENAYFDAYVGMILRCFAALHGNIENTRIKTKTSHYTKYFEEQCERAIHYWRLYHDKDHVFYYHDDVENLK